LRAAFRIDNYVFVMSERITVKLIKRQSHNHKSFPSPGGIAVQHVFCAPLCLRMNELRTSDERRKMPV
jgi:hypothetical protein